MTLGWGMGFCGFGITRRVDGGRGLGRSGSGFLGRGRRSGLLERNWLCQLGLWLDWLDWLDWLGDLCWLGLWLCRCWLGDLLGLWLCRWLVCVATERVHGCRAGELDLAHCRDGDCLDLRWTGAEQRETADAATKAMAAEIRHLAAETARRARTGDGSAVVGRVGRVFCLGNRNRLWRRRRRHRHRLGRDGRARERAHVAVFAVLVALVAALGVLVVALGVLAVALGLDVELVGAWGSGGGVGAGAKGREEGCAARGRRRGLAAGAGDGGRGCARGRRHGKGACWVAEALEAAGETICARVGHGDLDGLQLDRLPFSSWAARQQIPQRVLSICTNTGPISPHFLLPPLSPPTLPLSLLCCNTCPAHARLEATPSIPFESLGSASLLRSAHSTHVASIPHEAAAPRPSNTRPISIMNAIGATAWTPTVHH